MILIDKTETQSYFFALDVTSGCSVENGEGGVIGDSCIIKMINDESQHLCHYGEDGEKG